MDRTIEDFVRGLGIDAYLVGGAVRDELLGLDSKDADFVVPGVDVEGLRKLLEPHGRVEEFEVAGRQVGVRLYPRDRELRRLAPAGIEFAPPRAERSTGPGRHDFEIVADPSLSIEDDMARRDFTVNAIARRLETDELVDPFKGQADLEQRVLRTVGPRSFEEDPLRIVRGLRLVSQLGFEPDEQTLEQMREHAPNVRLVSGERVGGGLRADGMGELSKLLLGRRPATSAAASSRHGRARRALARVRTGDRLRAKQQAAAPAARRAHLRRGAGCSRVTAGATGGALSRPRQAERERRPCRAWREDRVRGDAQAALPDSAADVRRRVIVRAHAFPLDGVDELFARRFLREHGDELAFDLVAHKEADLRSKQLPQSELDAVARLRALLEQERSKPHRLEDLAVDGSDLIELGYSEGPKLGRALESLLDDVVEDPTLNTRDELLARARRRA